MENDRSFRKGSAEVYYNIDKPPSNIAVMSLTFAKTPKQSSTTLRFAQNAENSYWLGVICSLGQFTNNESAISIPKRAVFPRLWGPLCQLVGADPNSKLMEITNPDILADAKTFNLVSPGQKGRPRFFRGLENINQDWKDHLLAGLLTAQGPLVRLVSGDIQKGQLSMTRGQKSNIQALTTIAATLQKRTGKLRKLSKKGQELRIGDEKTLAVIEQVVNESAPMDFDLNQLYIQAPRADQLGATASGFISKQPDLLQSCGSIIPVNGQSDRELALMLSVLLETAHSNGNINMSAATYFLLGMGEGKARSRLQLALPAILFLGFTTQGKGRGRSRFTQEALQARAGERSYTSIPDERGIQPNTLSPVFRLKPAETEEVSRNEHAQMVYEFAALFGDKMSKTMGPLKNILFDPSGKNEGFRFINSYESFGISEEGERCDVIFYSEQKNEFIAVEVFNTSNEITMDREIQLRKGVFKNLHRAPGKFKEASIAWVTVYKNNKEEAKGLESGILCKGSQTISLEELRSKPSWFIKNVDQYSRPLPPVRLGVLKNPTVKNVKKQSPSPMSI